MRVLTVYAHHQPRSFCHALLERFTDGLRAGGHENEIVDLHAIRFDPVLRDRDTPSWIDDSVPDDVLARMNVKQSLLEGTRNPDDLHLRSGVFEHPPRPVQQSVDVPPIVLRGDDGNSNPRGSRAGPGNSTCGTPGPANRRERCSRRTGGSPVSRPTGTPGAC